MGMFDAFLGQDTGYTKAQSTGLRRSAEIKRRRKEDERAFERQKMKFEAREARGERRVIEAGETRRTAMGEAGATARERITATGQMARQRLTGRQEAEAATTAATRAARAKSTEFARGLTKGFIGHGHAMELTKVKDEDALRALFKESPSGAARGRLEGNQGLFGTKKPGPVDPKGLVGNQEIDILLSEKIGGKTMPEVTKYMNDLKKKDPDQYLKMAKRLIELQSPREKQLTNSQRFSGTPTNALMGGGEIRFEDGVYTNL